MKLRWLYVALSVVAAFFGLLSIELAFSETGIVPVFRRLFVGFVFLIAASNLVDRFRELNVRQD